MLSSNKIQAVLGLPEPTTQKQLGAFLGLTGYCKLWILEYGEKVRPLYKDLKENSQQGPTNVYWEK